MAICHSRLRLGVLAEQAWRAPGWMSGPGMIEIDLVDGVRLRVDAFVNERALRRVLAVLKAAS